MNAANPKVDFYFSNPSKFQKEVMLLRKLMLGEGLTEELKWGCPSYSLDGRNVVLIHQFKEYCALLFFKGALLKDPKRILVQQTKNVQAARQIRFTSLSEITKLQSALKTYVNEAVRVEKAGLTVAFKKTAALKVPKEFQTQLDAVPDLKAAFKALTPGRQRAYLLYFADAKQAKTREARVEKCLHQILNGKGMDD